MATSCTEMLMSDLIGDLAEYSVYMASSTLAIRRDFRLRLVSLEAV